MLSDLIGGGGGREGGRGGGGGGGRRGEEHGREWTSDALKWGKKAGNKGVRETKG